MNAIKLNPLYHYDTRFVNLNQPSAKLFDEILSLLETNIEPIRKSDNFYTFWIDAPRGNFEEWEICYYDKPTKSAGTRKKREKEFLEWHPYEYEWYSVSIIHERLFKYFQFGRLVIELDERDHTFGLPVDRTPADFTELFSYIKDKICSIIADLKAGEYNRKIGTELPYFHRYGTIPRNKYWELIPSARKRELKDLTQEEINRFINILESEGQDYIPENAIKDMTFRRYFKYAKIAYKAAGFEIFEDEVKLFFRYGEDFGGGVLENEIDYDSPQDFNGFYDEKFGRHGGHPWGIMRGSSRSRIMLYPKRTENGYYFRFYGNENWSCYEIVKMYYALKQTDLPVCFSCHQSIIKYLQEKDLVGIVPHDCFPAYCQSAFREQVNDFTHWNKEDCPELEPYITWEKLTELKLKEGDYK